MPRSLEKASIELLTGSIDFFRDDVVEVNFKAKPKVDLLAGKIPVLTIDDFYVDPDKVREQALRGHFERMEAGYPGRHEPLDMEQDEVLIAMTYIREVLRVAGNLEFSLREVSTDFSVLTTPSKSIHKSQSHPHTDGAALAGIIYLNPEPMGGTCFYRNKLLCDMLLTDSNKEQYSRIMAEHGMKETTGYVSDDFDMWELVHKTEGKYNQLVMYIGNLFHSVSVIKDPDPSDLNKARLTQRIFVNALSEGRANR